MFCFVLNTQLLHHPQPVLCSVLCSILNCYIIHSLCYVLFCAQYSTVTSSTACVMFCFVLNTELLHHPQPVGHSEGSISFILMTTCFAKSAFLTEDTQHRSSDCHGNHGVTHAHTFFQGCVTYRVDYYYYRQHSCHHCNRHNHHIVRRRQMLAHSTTLTWLHSPGTSPKQNSPPPLM